MKAILVRREELRPERLVLQRLCHDLSDSEEKYFSEKERRFWKRISPPSSPPPGKRFTWSSWSRGTSMKSRRENAWPARSPEPGSSFKRGRTASRPSAHRTKGC
ncbi:MAG: hypothetical protein MPW14_07225 [Candidatus Manganitrophus sp.]|nr:MAG: hypothetical protein MPW14_07225 [Candidatus Manganitrophus sp.]